MRNIRYYNSCLRGSQHMFNTDIPISGWLILIYRVPSSTSTSRVTIWKRVKELGALLLQQSVYILPNIPATREAVNNLKELIQHLGGESKILEIASLGEEQEREVIAGFNNNREEEYIEVIKACKELLSEIEEESKTEDFHFADLEENEKHLQRVHDLLDNVTKRDYFGSQLKEKAISMFAECEKKFGAFSEEVYSRAGILSDEKRSPMTFDFTANRETKNLARADIISQLRETVNKLNHDSLTIGGKKVMPLPEKASLEWGYKDRGDENSLTIKVSWSKKREAAKRDNAKGKTAK
jgi:hypothetical protein